MIRNSLLVTGVTIIASVSVMAGKVQAREAEPTPTESFEAVARQITANSPILKSYMFEAQGELEALKAENELPAPEIGFGYLWGHEGVGNKWTGSITQSFDWPGVYRARRRAAGKAEDAVEALRVANYCDKLLEVRLALVELVGARKKVALCKEIKDNIDRINELILESYQKGEATRLDVNKMKIESISVQRSFNDALAAEEVCMANLTALNGGIEPQLGEIYEYPAISLSSLETYKSLVADNNPQRAYRRASIEKAEAQVKAERLARLPGFSIGYEHEDEMGDKFDGFSLSVSLPFLTKRHSTKAAKLVASALKVELQASEEDELWRTVADYKKAVRLRDELAEYAPVVGNVDNVGLLKKAYEGGQMSLIDYLLELSYFTDAQQAYLELEQNYWQTVVSLDRYNTSQSHL